MENLLKVIKMIFNFLFVNKIALFAFFIIIIVVILIIIIAIYNNTHPEKRNKYDE